MSSDDVRRLEEKIAFLEHHLTQQDKVILELGDDVARLKRELRRLMDRVGGAQENAPLPEDERPPHY